jgi:hypothetical protein
MLTRARKPRAPGTSSMIPASAMPIPNATALQSKGRGVRTACTRLTDPATTPAMQNYTPLELRLSTGAEFKKGA